MDTSATKKLLVAVSLVLWWLGAGALQQPLVPCLFIFGDSLVDNGNNNRILSLARANYPPYGIDFPQGSSGRFTNGRTTVDVLAQLLGFRGYIPPYANTRGPEMLRGLNFASGAAGIRSETGNNLGDHYYMAQQLDNFRRAALLMQSMLTRRNATAGPLTIDEYLGKCIYAVGLGSNDYLNNYFMPNLYPTSFQYSARAYASLLLRDYEQHITELYEMGARKIILMGVGQIGCIPYELARYNASSSRRSSICNENINSAIALFNAGLIRLVNKFNGGFDGAKFVYVNSFSISNDIAVNADSYGFQVLDKGCCGVGRNNGQITCLPLQRPCLDRTKYVFWDAFHPTEAANIIYAKKAYYSTSPSDVYPINVQQLAMA